jgi:hypothetical protein
MSARRMSMTDLSEPIFRSTAGPVPPTAARPEAARWGRAVRTIAVVGLLAAVAWVSHFSQYRTFGFYSDDQSFACQTFTWDWPHMLELSGRLTHSFPEPQGRPLGFWLGWMIPFLCLKAGGVPAMFVAGWVILTINAVLVDRLVRRLVPTGPVPVLAGIFFILFPADTNREFLCAAHILQPSLTFMLVAALLYLDGGWVRRVFCYVLIAASLLTYENGMLPIYAVPLLEAARDRVWIRRSVWHGIIVSAIVGIDFLSRILWGEYRVMQATGSKLITLAEVIGGTLIGPASALRGLEVRFFQGIQDAIDGRPDSRLLLASATGVILLVAGLASRWGRWQREAFAPVAAGGSTDEPSLPVVPIQPGMIDYGGPAPRVCRAESHTAVTAGLGRLAWFGTATVFVSYLLSFTHFPPSLIEGQSTSVHLSTAVGAAVLLACAAGGLLGLRPDDRRWGIAVGLAVAVYGAGLLQAAIDEQRAYGLLWSERQQFWIQVLDLCPDLENGTMVICDGFPPRYSYFMPLVSWGDTLVFRQVYQLPGFTSPPELQPFTKTDDFGPWQKSVSRNPAGEAYWSTLPYGHTKETSLLPEGNIILLHVDQETGDVTREGGTIQIGGKPFRLKPIPRRQVPPFATLPFYSILTNRPAMDARPAGRSGQ